VGHLRADAKQRAEGSKLMLLPTQNSVSTFSKRQAGVLRRGVRGVQLGFTRRGLVGVRICEEGFELSEAAARCSTCTPAVGGGGCGWG
jgi:hypothetical protein